MQSKLEATILIEEKPFLEFIEFVESSYGLMLSWYNPKSLKRRLDKVLRLFNIDDLRSLQLLFIRDEKFFQKFIDAFTVKVTELFREPGSLKVIREDVLPLLRNKEAPKILLIGSSTGEELCSLAIILKELDLLDRVEITATDLSPKAISCAAKPCISKSRLKEAQMNYRRAGGTGLLEEYYQATSSLCYFHPSLLDRVHFQCFDITKDELDQKFDLIFCRNLLIYFQSQQHNGLVQRLVRHLKPGGFLSFGEQESIRFYKNHDNLQIVSSSQKIYRQNILLPY